MEQGQDRRSEDAFEDQVIRRCYSKAAELIRAFKGAPTKPVWMAARV
jgi:hypothetical protein